jgi:hypothetical protein
MMISTSIILSTGEKKWMPMKFSACADVSASEVIGRVEVLEAKTDVLADGLLRLLGRLRLDLAVLEHRLDDEVAALERRIVRRSAVMRASSASRVGLALALPLADLSAISFCRRAPCPCRRAPDRDRSGTDVDAGAAP